MARADTYRSPVVQRLKSVRSVYTGLVGAGMELGCFLGRVHNTTGRVHNTTGRVHNTTGRVHNTTGLQKF